MLQTSIYMDPMHNRNSLDAIRWSEWVESIRKDVECCFGVLKERFRFFKNAVCYHDPQLIEYAFKCACILHNMILVFDKRDISSWEECNWELVHPTGNDDGIIAPVVVAPVIVAPVIVALL